MENLTENKMNREQLISKVRAIVADTLGIDPEEVQLTSYLYTDLESDELDCIEIIMECEKQLEIIISDDDAEGLFTVGQLVDYIEKQMM